MATQEWLDKTLASIATIFHGDSKDHATKDEVAALSAELKATVEQLKNNDAKDAGQDEAAAKLEAAIDALVKQLAEAPPSVEPAPVAA